ncbi:MAG: caspase family protein, partial [bacterium]
MTKTALIIGAQDYDPRDGLTPLSCARNDALALGRVLREQCGFGDVRVLAGEGIAGSDGRPTKSAIRREINRLRESPKRIELLVVAFCAHGLTLPVGGADRYYLLPEDAHQHEPDSFLEFADLMRRLNEIPANDRAVIFDTCRNRPEAGRASGDNLLARDLSIELLTRPEDERKGTTAVLTACSLGERAYEMQDAGHGVFFHFLLQGMKGPAWTEQGTLSLNDAFGYAEREIAARKVFRQRPTFEQKGGGVILLGRREEPSASAGATVGQPRQNPEALADALDLAFWQSVQHSTVASDFEAYLHEFPQGRFLALAHSRLKALQPLAPHAPPLSEPRRAEGNYSVAEGRILQDQLHDTETKQLPEGRSNVISTSRSGKSTKSFDPESHPSEIPTFMIGDYVVYPTHGVGTVQGIRTVEAAGYSLQVIELIFEENRLKLSVPVNKASSSGLRKLCTTESFQPALNTLKGRARIKRTMWSRRAQEYEAKINSGDPVQIAEVVRDLFRNVGRPEQSLSERQIYEAALDRLAAEAAAIDRCDKT